MALGIYLKLYLFDKSEVAYSGSRDSVIISGQGVTNYRTLSNRSRFNKKNNSRTAITSIFSQYFMKLLEEFRDLRYLRYREKQVKSEATEDYLFLFSAA